MCQYIVFDFFFDFCLIGLSKIAVFCNFFSYNLTQIAFFFFNIGQVRNSVEGKKTHNY